MSEGGGRGWLEMRRARERETCSGSGLDERRKRGKPFKDDLSGRKREREKIS